MRDSLRDTLNSKMSRKQFLQFLGTALLMIFGIDNIISFLVSGNSGKHAPRQVSSVSGNGFGARKFGE